MNRRYLLILLPFLIVATFQKSRVESQRMSRAKEIECGDFFPYQCQKTKYRSMDGSCNNLLYPTWGMPDTRFKRLLPAVYSDGISLPRVSTSGRPLPLARTLSRIFSPDMRRPDQKWTLATMQYGQIIAHDTILSDQSANLPDPQCCTAQGKLVKGYSLNPSCFPLVIPADDPDYNASGIACLPPIVPDNTDLSRGCFSPNGTAEQLTTVTQFLDLSILYGSSDEELANLREGVGGRLIVERRNNHDWLPIAKGNFGFCNGANDVCYKAGDKRVNQNPQLTALQIVFLREHNRIGTFLSLLNPYWSDEELFQTTRKITIAEHQFISYYEWLTVILGFENSLKEKLIYDTEDYVNDYDPTVNPGITNEHASAAYRSLHTLIEGNLLMVNEKRQSISSIIRLGSNFEDATLVEEHEENYDGLLRGLCTQAQEAADEYHSKEITLFMGKRNNTVGADLRAADIHRGLEHGLASYNDYRSYCGLTKAKSWKDFLDLIPLEDVKKLSKLYESPDDVHLAVGAMLERFIPGSLTTPTFMCIMTEQFLRTRKGDRYWFENGDNEAAFTLAQLNEIRKASISRLLCDNGNDIKRMQLRGFEQISNTNLLVDCDLIPSINLSLWKEA